MSGDARPAMPPVRLPSHAELARDALAAPLFSRAVRLARWAGEGPGMPVGAGGELLSDQLGEAVERLGLADGEDGPLQAAEAWNLAVDTGLLEIEEDGTDDGADEEDAAADKEAEGGAVGTATPGEALDQMTGQGGPVEVLDIWQDGLETVLADAATPSFEDLIGGLENAMGEDGEIDPDSIDLDAMDWNPEEEAEFLDSALCNLYLLTATDSAVAAGAMVPLPVLAATMTVPEEMDEPTDEVLEEVSGAMMRLDEQFRILEQTGLIEYRPVDEALAEEEQYGGEDAVSAAGANEGQRESAGLELDDEDVARYGMVRLTSLGQHGVRVRMRDAGIDAPVVGDLVEADADRLLGSLPGYSGTNAQAEIEGWLAARTPVEAAKELLAAARGTEADAPTRRLACQQALSLLGAEAEPALREVLADRELGGLARVWLAERGAGDVPPPDEEMVFWLTVDTIAAQLATEGEPAELEGLIQGLVDQHAGFFDKAWKVDHPATGDVLEAMGRVHPDRNAAKEARKAAFKARSRSTA